MAKPKKELSAKQKEVLKKNEFVKGDTTDKAANGRLGGIASGISKRQNKQYEAFKVVSLHALESIQDPSLKALAKRANGILENNDSSPTEIKLALEIIQFLRDSSGQKPTDKQEVIADVKANYKLDTNVFKKAINDIDDLANEL